ncbi:predicted integral membrane protein [Malacoplasma penetrans HF-2]|uniref:Predicted integral membrane protein n=1 Tax=Malacoplasma penetrans (strain HF-2) TaxID=272633 RepID=Q8EW47_MALP2|nr:hypothetical protein [Malacoplasma penetrans]BAC44149.1 predicted integral membrane protein [Malacoplasma penetrans HF-2]
MKKKNNRLLLVASTLFSLSTIPVAAITTIDSINTTQISKDSSDLQAARDITTNNLTMQLHKGYEQLDWYGQNFSNAVTEQQLKQLIVPNVKFDVNYGINILTPTGTALTEGYVEFTVYQIKTNISGGVTGNPNGSGQSGSTVDGREDIEAPSNINYKDGNNTSPSGISMQAYTTNTTETVEINGKQVQKKYVWTTKNINGLFLKYKFSFSWNDNEKIGDFLRSTNKSALTANDVYGNMISTSRKIDILPSDIETNPSSIISFSQEDSELTTYNISSADAKQYGIGVVTVDFSSSTDGKVDSNWADGKVPNVKYLVRGLVGNNGSGSKEEMHLSTDQGITSFLNTTFSVSAIRAQNTNFKLPKTVQSTATTVKVSDFTPTELINALTTTSSGKSNLLDLLTKDTYLDKSSNANSLPALYLTYMGKTKFSKDTTGGKTTEWYGTGLFEMGNVPTVKKGVVDYNTLTNPANGSSITAITANADNASGTIYLNVTYNKYNVYQNTLEMGNEVSIIISGLQVDESANNGNKNLYFQWKSVDQLIFTNAANVMDLYNNNQSDTDFLKSLSNSFFEGSENTYNLDRNVTITNSSNQITITMEFPQFGEINGITFTNTYSLNSPDASSAGITFRSKDQVASSIRSALGISNLSEATPSQVIDAVADPDRNLSLSDFYSTGSSYTYSALILQSDTNDGVVVEVIAANNTNTYKYSYIYSGMAKGTSTSHIYNFAFDTSDTQLQSGLTTLRNIPIGLITKEDVYNYYVSKLPIYSGTNGLPLTINDFEITKDTINNSITITINIPIVANGSVDGTKTYSNTLKGFTNATIINNNSNTAMQNLTVPLSVSFALAIVLIMSGLITHQIIKRKKLAKSKINLKDIRKSVKK